MLGQQQTHTQMIEKRRNKNGDKDGSNKGDPLALRPLEKHHHAPSIKQQLQEGKRQRCCSD
jgi:hypothetical protein